MKLPLLDIDECGAFDPCEQVCTNTDGSYECSCEDGYIESEVSTSKCSGIKVHYGKPLHLCVYAFVCICFYRY